MRVRWEGSLQPTVWRHDGRAACRGPGRRGTILDDVAYWLTIASVYFLVGVLFFYSGKEKLFDENALFTFACLSFGQTSTGNNEGTSSLYTYFGATAIVMLLVLMLPPNRPRAWLSGLLR